MCTTLKNERAAGPHGTAMPPAAGGGEGDCDIDGGLDIVVVAFEPRVYVVRYWARRPAGLEHVVRSAAARRACIACTHFIPRRHAYKLSTCTINLMMIDELMHAHKNQRPTSVIVRIIVVARDLR